MKTLIRLLKLAILPFTVAMLFAGCGKSDNSNSSTTNTGYSYVNGICYNSSGQQVLSTYCTSTTSGYTYSNGLCYMTSTGQQVPTTYCTTSSSTGYTTQTCYGPYYYSNGYQTQLVYCNGSNCRGYILYTQTTYQPVMCQ